MHQYTSKSNSYEIVYSKEETENKSSENGLKDSEKEDALEQLEKTSIPPQNIKKLLEAGTLLQKERIQQSVSHKETSAENILEAEIKSDKLYGTDTEYDKIITA